MTAPLAATGDDLRPLPVASSGGADHGGRTASAAQTVKHSPGGRASSRPAARGHARPVAGGVSGDQAPGMTARTPGPPAHAETTPVYGMRPVGGGGVRGWRVWCSACGFLSRTYTNIRGCDDAKHRHRSRCDHSNVKEERHERSDG